MGTTTTDRAGAPAGALAMEAGRRRLKDLASENQSAGALKRTTDAHVERSWEHEQDHSSRTGWLGRLGLLVAGCLALAGAAALGMAWVLRRPRRRRRPSRP